MLRGRFEQRAQALHVLDDDISGIHIQQSFGLEPHEVP